MRLLSLFPAFFILTICACNRKYPDCKTWLLKKVDDRLTIVNSTADKITFSLSYEYPQDTLMLESYVPNESQVAANPGNNVSPASSKKYQIRSCWESTFENRIASGKLRIMIFNVDTIKAYTAKEIIIKGLYKSFLYTLDDLKELNWQAVYP